ncbi:hypothetical protein PR202_ga20180 [Eleusine coracana subsp. coracana]|uniref:NADP-dependent oxidoreductase domain-containing protein n=1 Tax=Eleusine coracana subsp. coracana TaxID=191504 RepID=A0AAV5CXH7_ELECO|nr:hypothetical protein PR202_ga20180 [Eleusine coracana subsp. coracana]
MASIGTPSSKIPDFPAGADGWAVPAMGLGTSMYRTVTEDIVAASVLSTLELGYRHFDTAALYGSTAPSGPSARDRGVEEGGVRDDQVVVHAVPPGARAPFPQGELAISFLISLSCF